MRKRAFGALTLAGTFLLARAAPARTRPPDAPAAPAIRAAMQAQVEAWNRGDLVAFMQGYWRSDRTEFVSAQGVQRGWQAVLARYQRTYPNRTAMGRLAFDHLEVTQLAPDAALAEGQYHLFRGRGEASGVFTLIWRRVPAGWRIVLDHTTAFAAAKPRP